MALGSDPVVLDGDEIATSREVQMDSKKFQTQVSWDFYSIDTESFQTFDPAIESYNHPEIENFLKAHARKSSVWPGNKEVLFWGRFASKSSWWQQELLFNGALGR